MSRKSLEKILAKIPNCSLKNMCRTSKHFLYCSFQSALLLTCIRKKIGCMKQFWSNWDWGSNILPSQTCTKMTKSSWKLLNHCFDVDMKFKLSIIMVPGFKNWVCFTSSHKTVFEKQIFISYMGKKQDEISFRDIKWENTCLRP